MVRRCPWVSGLAALLLIGTATTVTAQSECDAVLKSELQTTNVQSSERAQAARNYACSHTFDEFNDSYGGNASGAYGAISGSGAYNQTNYKHFQQDHCQDASTSEHESGFQFNTLRDASSGVVEAWQECMRNRAGFHCWAEPENQDLAILVHQGDPEPYKISSAVISDGTVLQSPSGDIAIGTPIDFGDKRIVFKRASPTVPFSFTLNIRSDFKSQSCRAAVPAVVILNTVPPPAEHFVATLADSSWCNPPSSFTVFPTVYFGTELHSVAYQKNNSTHDGLGVWLSLQALNLIDEKEDSAGFSQPVGSSFRLFSVEKDLTQLKMIWATMNHAPTINDLHLLRDNWAQNDMMQTGFLTAGGGWYSLCSRRPA
ncbi:hypothetical protein [Mesorhizobium sp. M0088]|uniref:hypothetical protein n=1 Tax=Mesorhizobium sp. M0088 TaxID=2956873 RepID=UPI00333CAD81